MKKKRIVIGAAVGIALLIVGLVSCGQGRIQSPTSKASPSITTNSPLPTPVSSEAPASPKVTQTPTSHPPAIKASPTSSNPTHNPNPQPTGTPTVISSPTPSPAPTPSPIPSPTAAPSPSPSPSPSQSPVPSPVPSPSPSPIPSPTPPPPPQPNTYTDTWNTDNNSQSWQSKQFDTTTNTMIFTLGDGNPSGVICSISIIHVGYTGWYQVYHGGCDAKFSVAAAAGTYDMTISSQDRSIGGAITVVG